MSISVNGAQMPAYSGETIATVLLANDVRDFHRTRANRPRAPFCNMGVCFECLVRVETAGWVRACMTPVRDGMSVLTGLCFADRPLGQSGRAHED